MLTQLVFLLQVNVKKSEKLTKIANIDEEMNDMTDMMNFSELFRENIKSHQKL